MTKGVKKNNFEILNKTKTNPSIDGLVFANMKEDVLGKDYELSLVIVGKDEIRKLNKSYRKINEATDILSFPLSKNEGEIFLCPEIALKEAPRFGRSYENFLNYLFIHGLTHLKGFEHSSRMDVKEERIRKKFGV
ncbi:MAG: rRNA maturation RNase YbeY [Patescibacteria group bacterium]